MKYQGTFLDVNGGYHTLVVGTGNDTPVNLKFGDSPFVTSMDTSDSTIYKPMKCQSGTIGLVAVGTDYLFGLYTGDAHGMPVTLYRGQTANPATVEWMGYVSPSLYDIGYEKYVEELDVDCIDGLSTLQYYKYKPIGTAPAIVSLLDLVRHCIAKCGCYTMMVMSTATRVSSTDMRYLWNASRISERNFLSQDTNAKDGEDDKTFQEVLEAVCQWMGVTCVAHGDTVYFIDYDALPDATHNTSIIVDVASGNITAGTMAVSEYSIDGTSYASNGTKLSLDKVYNKVTVVCEANDYEDMLDSPFDDLENITIQDHDFSRKVRQGNPYGIFFQPGDGDNAIITPWWEGGDDSIAVALKYYKSSKFVQAHYVGTDHHTTAYYDDRANHSATLTCAGAWIVRAYTKRIDNNPDMSLNWMPDWMPALDKLFASNDVYELNYSDYIFLTNCNMDEYITNQEALNYPYFSTSQLSPMTALFGGKNSYIIISADVYVHYRSDIAFPIDGANEGGSSGTCYADDMYLLCKLQIGDKWWNGYSWVSYDTHFRLPLSLNNKPVSEVLGHSTPLLNSVNWRLGIDEKGYVVDVPTQTAGRPTIMNGQVKLTLYKPMDFGTWYVNFMAIKDLKLTPAIADPTYSLDRDSETSYTNIIGENNVSELDDITMSVCTFDNKKPTLSAVAYAYDDYQFTQEMNYVDTTYHTALATAETGSTRYDGTISDGSMRQEEHMVFRVVNQYSEPSKMLDITLHDDIVPHRMVEETNIGATFIVDSKNVDYKAQTFTYKLIEKK